MACNNAVDTASKYHADDNPTTLSAWNLFEINQNTLAPHPRVTAYDLNTPLFSDYAHKFRTIWMPEGASAVYNASETFDFPVGTIISKTFYYPKTNKPGHVVQTDDMSHDFLGDGLDKNNVQLIETRILVRRGAGWTALPYVWNTEQTDAKLQRTGDINPLVLVAESGAETPFNYLIPNTNQCSGCHVTNNTTRELLPIGPKARHLNKVFQDKPNGVNQLQHWTKTGLLKETPQTHAAPKLANWTDVTASLDARARAYLDINCSHCHNQKGPADTSGLHFEPETKYGPHLGICKRSIAAGGGTGGHSYDIVPGEPENSILSYRLASTAPDEMMPELGRDTKHHEGVELLNAWIAEMQGGCGGTARK